jgi:hypothetical protein
MAKKKPQADASPEKPRGRPKATNPKGRTPIVMTVRGSDDWTRWLDEICETLKQQTGLGKVDRTDALDVALKDLAARLGLGRPPDRY